MLLVETFECYIQKSTIAVSLFSPLFLKVRETLKVLQTRFLSIFCPRPNLLQDH